MQKNYNKDLCKKCSNTSTKLCKMRSLYNLRQIEKFQIANERILIKHKLPGLKYFISVLFHNAIQTARRQWW